MPTEKASGRYRFSIFEVNPASGELLRQGARVRLQEQPFRLLVLLLERPGEVVSREELRSQLWPQDTFVEFDNSLNVAVRKLRDALRDDADTPRFVETIPRRGYRFVAEVTTVVAESTEPQISAASNQVQGVPVTGITTFTDSASTTSSHGKFPRPLLWAVITAAAALAIIGVARHFYHPGRLYALGNTDSVLVADFVNKTGDAAFDDTLKQALSISLMQSPFLNILPDRKVAETLKLMGRPFDQRMTGEPALEVCQRAGSEALLLGSIASLGNQYVIGIDAINCQTGAVFAQEQFQASHKEDVLNALGKASTHLRGKLGESLGTIQKFDAPLEQATTPSLEALKAYSAGWKIRNVKGSADSVPYFRHAIELDPNFALAYGALSTSYQMLGEDGQGSEFARKAYSLRDRGTERENFALSTYYYNFVLGDRMKALQNCRLWVDSYPRDLPPRICLFFDNEMIGRIENSLSEGQQCVATHPDAAPCYADLIVNYAALNRLDDAKATYREAISRGLENSELHFNRYGVAFLEGDTAEMDRQLASDRLGSDNTMLRGQANTEAYYGRFAKARELTRQVADSALSSDRKEFAARILIRSALQEALAGNVAVARQQTALALSHASFEYLQSMAALTEATSGDRAQAEKIANVLDKAYPSDTMLQAFWLPTIRAAIEINHKQPAKAIEDLAPAVPFELGEHNPLLPAYFRGQAYLAAARGPEAAAEFQKIIDHRGLIQNSILGSLANLGLARAWALQSQTSQAGARAKAQAAYQVFLELWKNADPDIPILKQAKKEYAGLR
jgi:DNA-binding winged helix-turn-helix (wHTH) protein